jgi:hypothetical protein
VIICEAGGSEGELPAFLPIPYCMNKLIGTIVLLAAYPILSWLLLDVFRVQNPLQEGEYFPLKEIDYLMSTAIAGVLTFVPIIVINWPPKPKKVTMPKMPEMALWSEKQLIALIAEGIKKGHKAADIIDEMIENSKNPQSTYHTSAKEYWQTVSGKDEYRPKYRPSKPDA